MYEIVTIKDTVRIPPKLFSDSIEESAVKALEEQYVGRIDKDVGVIITVTNPQEIGVGKVILGDGAAYYNITFDALVFKPELHEMVRAKVVDLTEFGAFLRFGPIDGLVHVSQIADDFVSFNDKAQCLAGKTGKNVIRKGDEVVARVIAVSLKDTIQDSKINLTMRQVGLGKEGKGEKGKKAEKPIKEAAKPEEAKKEKAEEKKEEKTEEKKEDAKEAAKDKAKEEKK